MTFHIAYACNEAYVVQTAVSMVSLCENNRGEQMMLYLIDGGIRRESLRKIQILVQKYRHPLKIIPLLSLFGQAGLIAQDFAQHGRDRHPDTIYAKLFLQDVCPTDRILYLDSDTVVAGSLAELWSMQMENIYIAGVQMPYTQAHRIRLGLPPETPYLCDGVLLINLQKWREDHVKEKCVAYIQKYHGKPPMLSEGTVNYVSHGLVGLLAPQYNLMGSMLMWNGSQLAKLYQIRDYYTEASLAQAREHPVIIHYLDELYVRPWYKNSDHPYRKVYLKYRRIAGFPQKDRIQKASLRPRTWLLRRLNRCLPFGVFCSLYHVVKGMGWKRNM